MIIDKMNNMTAAKITEEAELSQAPEVITPRPRAPIITMRATAADETEIEDAPAEQNLIETATEHVESTETTTDSEIATEPVAASESAEATEPVETSETTEELQSVSEVPVRRSERIARGISRPERYMLLTKIQKAMKTLAIDKEQAKFDAIQKEIIQLFEELKAIVPVMIADVPKDAEDLRCFIFLVEKFLANGEFNKIKARLVANRAQQKKELYPNKLSPTASVHAIFTCLTLVAYMCSYKVAKVDVKGAYIQMEISGSPIYMKMDKKLMTLALSTLPSL
jgi:G3E family GTPase